ncbi:MAG TPA: hypothetical protein VFZ69_04695 [Longimicrobiales bacterium]
MIMRVVPGFIAIAAVSTAVSGCGPHAEHGQSSFPSRPSLGVQVERAGRPLTGNALIGLFEAVNVSSGRKEAYNRATPVDWSTFVGDIQRSLAIYDAFDAVRGNQWLADREAPTAARYAALAKMLADDRLWIDSNSTVCTQFLAVELSAFSHSHAPTGDCGGRTPNYDAVDVYRSLLMNGSLTGLEDGVDRDDRVHTTRVFPFLAQP